MIITNFSSPKLNHINFGSNKSKTNKAKPVHKTDLHLNFSQKVLDVRQHVQNVANIFHNEKIVVLDENENEVYSQMGDGHNIFLNSDNIPLNSSLYHAHFFNSPLTGSDVMALLGSKARSITAFMPNGTSSTLIKKHPFTLSDEELEKAFRIFDKNYIVGLANANGFNLSRNISDEYLYLFKKINQNSIMEWDRDEKNAVHRHNAINALAKKYDLKYITDAL